MSEYAVLGFVVLIPFAMFQRTQKIALYVAIAGALGWMILRAPALLHAVASAQMLGH